MYTFKNIVICSRKTWKWGFFAVYDRCSNLYINVQGPKLRAPKNKTIDIVTQFAFSVKVNHHGYLIKTLFTPWFCSKLVAFFKKLSKWARHIDFVMKCIGNVIEKKTNLNVDLHMYNIMLCIKFAFKFIVAEWHYLQLIRRKYDAAAKFIAFFTFIYCGVCNFSTISGFWV